MDAFESVIATILDRQGYWTRTEVKVELTKQEKVAIGRPSSPRWEIDVVAYKPLTNELLAVECKSYFDSTGVTASAFNDALSQQGKRFKLFHEEKTREVVLSNLAKQSELVGLCLKNPRVVLCLAAGKVRNEHDQTAIEAHFAENCWQFFGPSWIRSQIQALESTGYENSVAAVTAKILLRPSPRVGPTEL